MISVQRASEIANSNIGTNTYSNTRSDMERVNAEYTFCA